MAITRSSKRRPVTVSAPQTRNGDFGQPIDSLVIQAMPNSSSGNDRLQKKVTRDQTSMDVIRKGKSTDVISKERVSCTEVEANGPGQPDTLAASEHERDEESYEVDDEDDAHETSDSDDDAQETSDSSFGDDQQPKKRKRGRPRKVVIGNGQALPTDVEHNPVIQPLVIAASQSESHDDTLVSDETSYSPSISLAAQRMTISYNRNSQGRKKWRRDRDKIYVIANRKRSLTKVEFNELGQPVGDNAASFVSFLGCLVREKIPITSLERWKGLSIQCKDDLWSSVQQNYRINDCYRKDILKRMGMSWRNYKGKITKEIYKISQSDDASHQLALLKPDNIKSSEEWEAFVKQRTSAEFKVMSEKYRRLRANQPLLHTLGRRGYACLLHEMKKKSPTPSKITRVDVWTRAHLRKDGKPINEAAAESIRKLEEYSKSPEAQTGISPREDALAKLFGPERRDQVRGLGFGATASKVDVEIRGSGSKVHRLEYEVKDLRQQVVDLKAMLLQETRQKFLQGQNVSDEDTMHSSKDIPQGCNVRDEETMHSSGAISQDWNARGEEMMHPSGDTQDNLRDEGMMHSSGAAATQGQNVRDEGMVHSSRAIPLGQNASEEEMVCSYKATRQGPSRDEQMVYSRRATPQISVGLFSCLGRNVRDEKMMWHFSSTTTKGQNVRDEGMMHSSEAISLDQNVRDEGMVYSSRATTQGQNVRDGEMMMHSSRVITQGEEREIMHKSGATTQAQPGSDNLVPANCKLIHWMGTEVVANAELVSKDPRKLVHLVKLGPDCWEVRVNQVTVDDVPLYRPTIKMFCLEDAVGSMVAWPSKYITME
uniref:DUF8039 domain-containing protein n=1 Tax=Paeonia lactiflora TaxID=35924 RepID=A0AA96SGH8_PAELC|nr:hypothetical protein [Paeonia lactiflora]